MAELPVLGPFPIGLTVGGQDMTIPLSLLYFDSSGTLQKDRWPLYPKYKQAVDDLLDRLVKEGVLTPGTKPGPLPAFSAKAVTAGTIASVSIVIDSVKEDPKDPANGTFDITVTETDTYAGLDMATLASVLGTDKNIGSRPGLVFVSAVTADLPDEDTYELKGNPPTASIPSGAKTAFTVTARGKGDEAKQTVQIVKDPNVKDKFTLIATWTLTAKGVKVAQLADKFKHVLTISPPPPNNVYLTPRAGKLLLSGGSDAKAPVPCSGTVFAE